MKKLSIIIVLFSFSLGNKILAQTVYFSEGFETASFPPAGWVVTNPDSFITWQRTTAASGFGASAASAWVDANNYGPGYGGAEDYLISPVIDLSSAGAPLYLNFNVAYARYGGSSYWDRLVVRISVDGGASWQLTPFVKQDTALATAPDNTGTFTPSASQWRAESVDISNIAGQPNVKIRIEFQKVGWGNNLYVDDVAVSSGSSVSAPTAVFNVNDNSVCAGQSVTFTDQSTPAGSITSWFWSFPGGTPSAVNNLPTATTTYSSAGTYTATLTVTNAAGTDTQTAAITVFANPVATSSVTDETIPPGNNGAIDLTISGGASPYSYNWSNSSITQDLTGIAGGNYIITVTDANSCTSALAVSVGTIVGMERVFSSDDITIYPNPVSDRITIFFQGKEQGDVFIKIYDMLGKVLFHSFYENSGETINIGTEQLQNGLYFLFIQYGEKKLSVVINQCLIK